MPLTMPKEHCVFSKKLRLDSFFLYRVLFSLIVPQERCGVGDPQVFVRASCLVSPVLLFPALGVQEAVDARASDANFTDASKRVGRAAQDVVSIVVVFAEEKDPLRSSTSVDSAVGGGAHDSTHRRR